MGDLDKVKKCITEGADINRGAGFEPEQGELPIVFALRNGFVDVAEYLYEQGADCSQIIFSEIGKDAAARKWFQEKLKTALYEAFPAPEKDIRTIAHQNLFFKEEKEYSAHRHEKSALTAAAEIGDLSFIQRATAGKKDSLKIIDVAASNGHREIVAFALAAGEKPFFALHAAMINSQEEVIDYLLTQGVDVNQQESFKRTPLMLAVKTKNIKLVERLLKIGADVTKSDMDGETALHIAARVGDLEILNLLLRSPAAKKCLHKKNIYGWTPLTVAIQYGNDSVIAALSSPQELAVIKQSPHYGYRPIAIDQAHLLNKMLYYLISDYRSTEMFSQGVREIGVCNGLGFLYQLFKARGMRDYFFDTLERMVSWEGAQATLDKPFVDVPQARFYKNLRDLFEQWINNVILFQSSVDVLKTSQEDRIRQYATSGGSEEYQPHVIYKERDFLRTEDQLREILVYLKRMPKGIRFDFSGAVHATSADVESDSAIDYYDSNFHYKTESCSDAEEFLRRVIDYKYTSLGATLDFSFSIYFFEKDEEGLLENFEVFSPEEMPKSPADAKAFQDKSPNRFTHVHVAVTAGSLKTLQQLIIQGHCDINATDCHGRTVLNLAVENGNSDAVKLILSVPSLNANLDYLAVKAYQAKEIRTVVLLMNDDRMQNMSGLLHEFITGHDLPLVEQLIIKKKVDINAYHDNQPLPLTQAMKMDDEPIVKYLLANGANVNQKDVNYETFKDTPLLRAMYSKKYYPLLIQRCTDINHADEEGNTLAHFAARTRNIDVLRDLINRGADVTLKNKKGKTPREVVSFLSKGRSVFQDLPLLDREACIELLEAQEEQKNQPDEDAKPTPKSPGTK